MADWSSLISLCIVLTEAWQGYSFARPSTIMAFREEIVLSRDFKEQGQYLKGVELPEGSLKYMY